MGHFYHPDYVQSSLRGYADKLSNLENGMDWHTFEVHHLRQVQEHSSPGCVRNAGQSLVNVTDYTSRMEVPSASEISHNLKSVPICTDLFSSSSEKLSETSNAIHSDSCSSSPTALLEYDFFSRFESSTDVSTSEVDCTLSLGISSMNTGDFETPPMHLRSTFPLPTSCSMTTLPSWPRSCVERNHSKGFHPMDDIVRSTIAEKGNTDTLQSVNPLDRAEPLFHMELCPPLISFNPEKASTQDTKTFVTSTNAGASAIRWQKPSLDDETTSMPIIVGEEWAYATALNRYMALNNLMEVITSQPTGPATLYRRTANLLWHQRFLSSNHQDRSYTSAGAGPNKSFRSVLKLEGRVPGNGEGISSNNVIVPEILWKGSSRSSVGSRNVIRICRQCKTMKTPLWRNGPSGPKSLCNACGIRYRKEQKRCAKPLKNLPGIFPISNHVYPYDLYKAKDQWCPLSDREISSDLYKAKEEIRAGLTDQWCPLSDREDRDNMQLWKRGMLATDDSAYGTRSKEMNYFALPQTGYPTNPGFFPSAPRTNAAAATATNNGLMNGYYQSEGYKVGTNLLCVENPIQAETKEANGENEGTELITSLSCDTVNS